MTNNREKSSKSPRFLNTLSGWILSSQMLFCVLGTGSGIVGTNYFAYDNGYDSGYETGKTDGFEVGQTQGILQGQTQFDVNQEARLSEALDELDKQIAVTRQTKMDELEVELDELRLIASERRATEESEHRANLERIIFERYQAKLDAVRRDAHAQGVRYGEDQANAVCTTQINNMSTSGALWQNFEQSVADLVNMEVVTETGIRSLAQAIVEISAQGRQASDTLRPQLNGLVDEMEKALKDNDLELVREIALSLEKSLSAKKEIWEAAMRVLVSGG